MSKHVIRLGLIQHASPIDADKATVLATTVKLIREAAARGAQVVATQELFISHYFPQVEDDRLFALAEPIPGPTSQTLCDLARELKIELTASLFERRAVGVYHNTSIMIDPSGQIVGRYRKMHIPDDPRFFEKYYFTPGDAEPLGWQVQRLCNVTTGMLVCWDQWFPEAARLTALKGAQILFYPTAIGWYHGETPEDARQQKDAWITIQRSHAIANGVFVAAINRVGVEKDLKFWGSSFVCDPGGTIIAQASAEGEEVLIAECDLGRIEAIRHGWPFLRDRRVDAYGNLTRRLMID
jgi:N-carbamoylputrescine amidase